MKTRFVGRNLGASPPEDADEYLANEMHPVVREIRAKVNELADLSWAGFLVRTTGTTATAIASLKLETAYEYRIKARVRGMLTAGDSVSREWDIVYVYDGTNINLQSLDLDTGPVYPPTASEITSATAELVDAGNGRLELKVTGEPNTDIDWTAFTLVQVS